MKNLNKTFVKITMACTFISLAILSCKKTDTGSTPTSTTGFTFKVDGGTAITADSATAILYSTRNGRQMDVYAYKGGSEIMEFHFDPKAGTKVVGTTLGTGAFLTYMESATKSYDSQSGTMNVTLCDTVGKKVEGDFSFSAKQYPYTSATAKAITEGHMVITKITK